MSIVLAVDDDPDVLALLEVTLRRGGYRVKAAASADEAISFLAEGPVDLILLDVMMPGRDGWELLDELKANEELSSIPVIMVTAKGEIADRLRGGLGGALRHVTKPFLPQTLLEAVHEALSDEQPEPERRRQVQRRSLSELASLEAGRDTSSARPRLAALSHTPQRERTITEAALARLPSLTPNQLHLVAELGRGSSVAQVAADREVSRSNVYASIRRIHRKLGTSNVADLASVAVDGGLVTPDDPEDER